MKRSIFIPFLAWSVFATALPPSPEPASEGVPLEKVFAAALKQSEVVATQEEAITQAEEHYKQAVGAVLPTLTGTASIQDQQTPPGGSSEFAPSFQPLLKVGLAQPVFRGFREFAALRQTRDLGKAQEEAKTQAVKQLFLDTAQNFYSVLTLEQDLRNLQGEIDAYDQRIKELQGRVKIGRSRVTEVLTVQASLTSLRSTIASTRSQLDAMRETFHFLTGLPPETPLKDDLSPPGRLPPVESFLSQVDARPDVRGNVFQLSAAEENVSIAKGAYLPSLDVTGNYYPYRVGFLQDVHWDVGLALTIPLFSGGVLESKVHEANSLQSQAELAVQRTKRAAQQEVSTLYKTLKWDVEQHEQLESSRDLSERNFKEQTKEYRLGLVNNLDVLQALTSFEETLRERDRALFVEKLDYLRLQASAGSKLPISTSGGSRP